MVQVLARRTKNNPVLIGEPGVGKTAVVEGLAQRLVAGDVPDSLKGRRLVSLDLAVDGGRREVPRRVRGAAQGRAERDPRRRGPGHHLHRRAAHRRRRRRHRRLLDGRRQHAQADAGPRRAADDRRHHAGRVPASGSRRTPRWSAASSRSSSASRASRTPSPSCAGCASATRRTTRCAITDAALVAAATLSNRYITSRQLPDKAIDLIDEAASRLRMEIDSSPEEIDQLRRTVDRMKMQRFALEKESDPGSVERLHRLAEELADAEEELRALEARWEAEKQGLNRVGDLKADRRAADRGRPGPARGRPGAGQRDQLRRDPRAGEASSRRPTRPRASCRPMVSEQVGPQRHRRGGAPTGPASRSAGCCRARARSCWPWSTRLGERLIGQQTGRQGGLRRRPALAGRHLRPQPAHRLVPVPRPDRRRQDRAGQVAGGVPVRRRARDGPDRHERVLREALGRRGWSVPLPATSATRRAASSPRRSGAARTRWCCWTRSRRPTARSSTSCCRCSTTAG